MEIAVEIRQFNSALSCWAKIARGISQHDYFSWVGGAGVLRNIPTRIPHHIPGAAL